MSSKRKRLSPGDTHYVNNKEFYQDMVEYAKIRKAAREKWEKETAEGKETRPWKEVDPPLTNEIGRKIMLIAHRLAYRPNFINYPHRDEMIEDAIENCVMYGKNFDCERYDNPFAYFTQICYQAFLRRIAKEKKQFLTKVKLVQQSCVHDEFATQDQDVGEDFSNEYRATLRSFYDVELPDETTNKDKTNKKKTPVMKLLEDTDE